MAQVGPNRCELAHLPTDRGTPHAATSRSTMPKDVVQASGYGRRPAISQLSKMLLPALLNEQSSISKTELTTVDPMLMSFSRYSYSPRALVQIVRGLRTKTWI